MEASQSLQKYLELVIRRSSAQLRQADWGIASPLTDPHPPPALLDGARIQRNAGSRRAGLKRVPVSLCRDRCDGEFTGAAFRTAYSGPTHQRCRRTVSCKSLYDVLQPMPGWVNRHRCTGPESERGSSSEGDSHKSPDPRRTELKFVEVGKCGGQQRHLGTGELLGCTSC